jgi:hypothetical protein
VRSASRQLALLAALLAALAASTAPARADGDPASDFLLSQSTFLSPFDGHVAKAESTRLVQMLAQLKQKGFPLKVAVIVTRYDLGAVPVLFGSPQRYATFLGEEDYYYWKDELLVVMADGYGLYKAKALPAADRTAIAALPLPGAKDGTSLVAAAERAVEALAAKHGLTITAAPATGSGSGSSSTWRDRGVIAAAVLAAGLLALAGRFVLRRRRTAA